MIENRQEANNMINEFQDKHVVVTGGNGGLGTTVVEMLLERGAWCHVPCMGDVGQLGDFKHNRLRTYPGVDLSDEAAVASFYTDLPAIWASIHLVGGFRSGLLRDTSLSDFRALFELNVTTCFLCSREAVRAMRAKSLPGAPSSGRIVNVSARKAVVPSGGTVAYSVSKSAVVALTQCLAEELKDEGILVNAIAPSIIDTPANRAARPDADFATWPSPAEVAETILFLASPRNSLTTGAVIPVYGRG